MWYWTIPLVASFLAFHQPGFQTVVEDAVPAVRSAGDICKELADPPSADSLMVLFWNLENFFDYQDDGQNPSDRDFSPEGSRHWSAARFYRKCNLIAKSIFWIASEKGRMPDVAGFAEVENKRVLYRLLNGTALRKMGYKVVHYESPDHRGIDVALLYRSASLRYLSSRPIGLPGMSTRDLLHVRLASVRSGLPYDFIVCHLPSKYGGAATSSRRQRAAGTLRAVVDSIQAFRLVVMGDFNDVPEAAAFDTLRPVLQLQQPSFLPKLPAVLPASQLGKGTICFNGKWEWIDLFWTTPQLSDNVKMEIVRVPFLIVKDQTFSGEKPLRTYVGPRYAGGVSDHCPILLEITQQEKDSLPGRSHF